MSSAAPSAERAAIVIESSKSGGHQFILAQGTIEGLLETGVMRRSKAKSIDCLKAWLIVLEVFPDLVRNNESLSAHERLALLKLGRDLRDKVQASLRQHRAETVAELRAAA